MYYIDVHDISWFTSERKSGIPRDEIAKFHLVTQLNIQMYVSFWNVLCNIFI
jgi:hypothetical protein